MKKLALLVCVLLPVIFACNLSQPALQAGPTGPTAPAISASPGNTLVTVTWAPVATATSYNLYWMAGSTVDHGNWDEAPERVVSCLGNGSRKRDAVRVHCDGGEQLRRGRGEHGRNDEAERGRKRTPGANWSDSWQPDLLDSRGLLEYIKRSDKLPGVPGYLIERVIHPESVRRCRNELHRYRAECRRHLLV